MKLSRKTSKGITNKSSKSQSHTSVEAIGYILLIGITLSIFLIMSAIAISTSIHDGHKAEYRGWTDEVECLQCVEEIVNEINKK